MFKNRCVFVEKKKGFDVEAKSLLDDFRSNLRMDNLESVRVINKYIIGEVSDEYYKKALHTIFSELTVDKVYEEKKYKFTNCRSNGNININACNSSFCRYYFKDS